MVDFVRGPMVWIAFGVFFVGLAWQGFRFFKLTRKKSLVHTQVWPQASSGRKKKTRWIEAFSAFLETAEKKYRASVFATHPIMIGVTVVFHVCLFVTPIFLLAHNSMLENSIGFGLPSLPEALGDFLTLLVLSCGLFFLLRRLFVRRVRAITGWSDWGAFGLTLAPFVSGFLAYHQWFDYRTVLFAHIVLGELMLISIPFTKLGHMIFFFFYRFFLAGEYSFGQGRRMW